MEDDVLVSINQHRSISYPSALITDETALSFSVMSPTKLDSPSSSQKHRHIVMNQSTYH
jgi:hypothetical protein